MAQRKAHAWLAEEGFDLPPMERRRFTEFYDNLAEDAPYRKRILVDAARYLSGALTPAGVGELLASARLSVDMLFASARAVGRLAVAAGEPEARVADALGVDRMTLRKWQGKR